MWVAEYYMKNYSTPYVLGMLAHEFGVHPLASAHEEVREEDDAFADGSPIVVPGLVKGDGSPRFLTTAPRPEGPPKQADHILVTRPGGQRFRAYQAVSVAYARLLHDNSRLQKAGRNVQPLALRRFRCADGDLADFNIIHLNGDARAFRHHRHRIQVADLQLHARFRLRGGQKDGPFAAAGLALETQRLQSGGKPPEVRVDLLCSGVALGCSSRRRLCSLRRCARDGRRDRTGRPHGDRRFSRTRAATRAASRAMSR